MLDLCMVSPENASTSTVGVIKLLSSVGSPLDHKLDDLKEGINRILTNTLL